MSTLRERKWHGEETLKRYRRGAGNDPYAAATEAIADILLTVAQSHDEARRILQNAEVEFNYESEGENFLTEG